MANSQNEWPLVLDNTAGRQKLTDLILPGKMPHHVYVLEGDVATVFRWLVAQYQRRVEPIKSAGCWGWNVRKIGDGDDWSNHSSATALDINAPQNPDGAPPERVMTDAQIAQCHALERESDGVLRWGGDWSDPDPMHWEIIKDRAAVHAFAITLIPQKRWIMAVSLNGYALPKLMEGDDDNKMAGYDYVRRAQLLLNFTVNAGLKIDGEYGAATTAAVKKLASNGNGKTVGLAEWAQLYGLGKASTS